VRVAALYDVHGNLPALEAVLADVDAAEVETIVSGGDLVAGPLPSECLTLLRKRETRFIRGNADRLVLSRATDEDAWMDDRLTAEERAEVAAWPTILTLDVDGLGRVLFCHGSPRSDDEVLTARTREEFVAEALEGAEADVIVCGHTHHQFDRRIGARRLVNAGSVGLPYEGRPGAFWALLGPGVELRRTEYDIEAGAERMRSAGLAGLDDYLRSSLFEPITPEAAIAGMEPEARRGA
jgi:putative phosphoesterase